MKNATDITFKMYTVKSEANFEADSRSIHILSPAPKIHMAG